MGNSFRINERDVWAEMETEYARDYADAIDNAVDTVENIRAELDRKLALARKYGMDEASDEIVRLLSRLNDLRHGRA